MLLKQKWESQNSQFILQRQTQKDLLQANKIDQEEIPPTIKLNQIR